MGEPSHRVIGPIPPDVAKALEACGAWTTRILVDEDGREPRLVHRPDEQDALEVRQARDPPAPWRTTLEPDTPATAPDRAPGSLVPFDGVEDPVRVALDIDGTVLDWTGSPYPGVPARVRRLVSEDRFVGYVTYRSEHAKDRTRDQLVEAGLPGGPIRACPPTGVSDAAGVKAAHLVQLDATHYVGDADFDRRAAKRAIERKVDSVTPRRPPGGRSHREVAERPRERTARRAVQKERDRRRSRRPDRQIRKQAPARVRGVGSSRSGFAICPNAHGAFGRSRGRPSAARRRLRRSPTTAGPHRPFWWPAPWGAAVSGRSRRRRPSTTHMGPARPSRKQAVSRPQGGGSSPAEPATKNHRVAPWPALVSEPAGSASGSLTSSRSRRRAGLQNQPYALRCGFVHAEAWRNGATLATFEDL